MSDELPFNPDWSSPPCDTIADIMNERGWNKADVAVEMCDDPNDEREASVYYVVLELMFNLPDDTRLTTSDDTCRRLAKALGATEGFWRRRFDRHRDFCLKHASEQVTD